MVTTNSPGCAGYPDLLLNNMNDPTFTEQELERLTGYRRGAEQLQELHRQGFTRARRDRLGRVVLERRHYDAVCSGATVQARPQLRLKAA